MLDTTHCNTGHTAPGWPLANNVEYIDFRNLWAFSSISLSKVSFLWGLGSRAPTYESAHIIDYIVLGPYRVHAQTASWSVQPLSQGSRSWPTQTNTIIDHATTSAMGRLLSFFLPVSLSCVNHCLLSSVDLNYVQHADTHQLFVPKLYTTIAFFGFSYASPRACVAEHIATFALWSCDLFLSLTLNSCWRLRCFADGSRFYVAAAPLWQFFY